MNLSLSELQKLTRELGLVVVKSSHFEARGDYLGALRNHFLEKDYPSGQPYQELTPMLCFDYQKLGPKAQDMLWCDDNSWIAQEKLNGVRVVLHFIKGKGVYAHGRAIDQSTWRRSEFTDYLPFADFIPSFNATVDTEAIVSKPVSTHGKKTTTTLHSTSALLAMKPEASKLLQVEQKAPLLFHVFDIVHWSGKDLKSKRFDERGAYLADFKEAIVKAGLGRWFVFPPIRFQGKKEFFDEIVKGGGEGVVFKSLASRYVDRTSRSRAGWIKHKRMLTFDAFVSGFTLGTRGGEFKNKVAVLEFSITTELGFHLIARVSTLPYSLRKRISLYDASSKTVSLNGEIAGMVATLGGQELAARSLRLSHPRILRWCKGLTAEHCRYSLDDFKTPSWGPLPQPLKVIEGNEDKGAPRQIERP